MAAIRPNSDKPRGAPRVNDRRVLNGIFWILRSGAPWRDLPESFGPYTTCYNRFVRWRMAGIWDSIMEALAETHDGSVHMIDTSIVRVDLLPEDPLQLDAELAKKCQILKHPMDHAKVSSWPIGDVASRRSEVRSLSQSGPDLLDLSSSRFDPKQT